VRLSLFWMTELAKLDRALSVYFTAVAFLHSAHKITRGDFDLLDAIATTCLQFNDLRRCRNARHSSVLSLSQATMLMKVVASNSCSTVQLIEIELCKAYLYRALRCKDTDNDSVFCLANVYLAVLYYTRGQYRMAIDHCKVVTKSQGHSQCSSHVVQGELLPQTDNEIDSVLGLAVFYQYIRTAALSQQQRTQHVSVFTTELFAHYLCIRCLSDTQCRQLMPTPITDEIHRYQVNFNESSEMFITDVLAFKSVIGSKYPGHLKKLTSVEDQTLPVISTWLDTSELSELLKQSAVEHLTKFRQLELQKFGSVAVIVTTDYEALYAYKRGDYQRCLRLSTHNVCTLIDDSRYMTVVFAYPEFIQLMDDVVVSLIGLVAIVNASERANYEYLSISQLSISLYLMTQCQMKLHSMTSLALTLDYIEVARRSRECQTLDKLLLKLTQQQIQIYIRAESD